jgi:hypothetical protein
MTQDWFNPHVEKINALGLSTPSKIGAEIGLYLANVTTPANLSKNLDYLVLEKIEHRSQLMRRKHCGSPK